MTSPCISFAGDTDTGLYRVTANTLGLVAGGANIGNVTTSGIMPGTTNTYNVGANGNQWAAGFFGDVTLGTATSDTGTLKFTNIASAFTTTFVAGVQPAASITYTLPVALVGAGSALVDTTGTGVLGWTSAAAVIGSGTANQVAYWTSASQIAGDAGMTYDAATDALTLAGNLLWKSGTAFTMTFDHAIGADRTVTFQDVAGTVYVSGGTDVAITDGGTGASTAVAAFNALSPSTTLGDLIYHDGTDDVRLAGNTTTTRKFLRQTGDGAASAAPAWDTIVVADIPNADLIGTANQVILSASGVDTLLGATNITLSLPQSIATTSTPQFLRMGLGAAAAAAVTLYGSVSDALTSPTEEWVQASTGDVGTRYTLSGANSFMLGIDNSDSDKFKISYGATGNAALGTNDYMVVGTDGAVVAPIVLRVGTATDGSTTTGNVAFGLTGGNRMHFDVDSGGCDFRMYRPDATASGPRFLPRKDRSGGACLAGDSMFDFAPLMANTTPAEVQGALLRFSVDDPTAGSEDGKIDFFVTIGGVTTRSFMIMNSVGITIDNGSVGFPLAVKSWYNGGTVTDAATAGDLATGLTGAARIFYDQSADLFYQYTSGSVAHQIRNGLYAYKSADETVTNSTTLQNDDALTVTVAASVKYHIRATIFITSASTTAGFKFALGGTCTVTSLKAQLFLYDDTTNALAGFTRAEALGTSLGAGLGAGDNYAVIDGTVEVNAAGTLLIQWAQNTADVLNGTTVERNSDLVLERMT